MLQAIQPEQLSHHRGQNRSHRLATQRQQAHIVELLQQLVHQPGALALQLRLDHIALVHALEHLEQAQLRVDGGAVLDADVEDLREFPFQLLDRGAQLEEADLEVLRLVVEVHDVGDVGLEVGDGAGVLGVDLDGEQVHVLVVGAADRDGLGEDLEVAHGLDELEGVVAALHEDVEVEEAGVVALWPRACLAHDGELVQVGGVGAVGVGLDPPDELLVEVDLLVELVVFGVEGVGFFFEV